MLILIRLQFTVEQFATLQQCDRSTPQFVGINIFIAASYHNNFIRITSCSLPGRCYRIGISIQCFCSKFLKWQSSTFAKHILPTLLIFTYFGYNLSTISTPLICLLSSSSSSPSTDGRQPPGRIPAVDRPKATGQVIQVQISSPCRHVTRPGQPP